MNWFQNCLNTNFLGYLWMDLAEILWTFDISNGQKSTKFWTNWSTDNQDDVTYEGNSRQHKLKGRGLCLSHSLSGVWSKAEFLTRNDGLKSPRWSIKLKLSSVCG